MPSNELDTLPDAPGPRVVGDKAPGCWRPGLAGLLVPGVLILALLLPGWAQAQARADQAAPSAALVEADRIPGGVDGHFIPPRPDSAKAGRIVLTALVGTALGAGLGYWIASSLPCEEDPSASEPTCGYQPVLGLATGAAVGAAIGVVAGFVWSWRIEARSERTEFRIDLRRASRE